MTNSRPCFTFKVVVGCPLGWASPGLWVCNWRPSETCSWDYAKRLQFAIGGIPLVETVRAIACRQTEKASCFIFQPLRQRKLPTEKIRRADLALFPGGVRIVCGSKYSSRRHLVHEQSDDRRRPDGHVDPGTALRQTARDIVPPTDDIDPQSQIGIFRCKRTCLVKIGQRLFK